MTRVKQMTYLAANKRTDSWEKCRWKVNRTKAFRKQVAEAVEYCKKNQCRGYAALSTKDFSLIADARTINKRLDADILEEKMYEDRQVLTVDQEKGLVQYVINKNCAYQPLSGQKKFKNGSQYFTPWSRCQS